MNKCEKGQLTDLETGVCYLFLLVCEFVSLFQVKSGQFNYSSWAISSEQKKHFKFLLYFYVDPPFGEHVLRVFRLLSFISGSYVLFIELINTFFQQKQL